MDHAIMRYFAYKHLPARLQNVSRQFHDLAQELARAADARAEEGYDVDFDEVGVALRKLLEAKDAAVRSVL